jgi:hypothetical protein
MTYSILLTLYDDLEAMTVSYSDKDGTTVTANCLNIDERMDSIETAHLPCRLLMSTAQDSGVILKGAGAKMTWNITDLFLLETVARDMGTFVMTPVLKRYEVAYTEALSKLWNIVHGWSTETLTLTLNMQVGKFEYPLGSGALFYGVKCDLSMEEIF